jgi:hypothetical protein
MCTDQYLKNILQLKFLNNVELTRVLAETLKISVNTKHCNSVIKILRGLSHLF